MQGSGYPSSLNTTFLFGFGKGRQNLAFQIQNIEHLEESNCKFRRFSRNVLNPRDPQCWSRVPAAGALGGGVLLIHRHILE